MLIGASARAAIPPTTAAAASPNAGTADLFAALLGGACAVSLPAVAPTEGPAPAMPAEEWVTALVATGGPLTPRAPGEPGEPAGDAAVLSDVDQEAGEDPVESWSDANGIAATVGLLASVSAAPAAPQSAATTAGSGIGPEKQALPSAPSPLAQSEVPEGRIEFIPQGASMSPEAAIDGAMSEGRTVATPTLAAAGALSVISKRGSLPLLSENVLNGAREIGSTPITVPPQISASPAGMASAAFAIDPPAPPTASIDLITRHLDVARDGLWLDGLARDIAATAGSDRLTFALRPEALGRLDVSIERHDGGMHVELATKNDTARAIMSEAQPRLLDEIRAHGIRSVSGSVATDVGADPRHSRHTPPLVPPMETELAMRAPSNPANRRAVAGRYA